MKQIKLTINVDPVLHKQFKVMCALSGKSLRHVLTQFMEEFTKRYINDLTIKGPK